MNMLPQTSLSGLPLFNPPARPAHGPDRRTSDHFKPSMSSLFKSFDVTHPDVCKAFVSYTFELIGNGMTHYSADGVLHRVRWHMHTSAKRGVTHPKINNNFAAFYARKFVTTYPSCADFFELRKSKADAAAETTTEEEKV